VVGVALFCTLVSRPEFGRLHQSLLVAHNEVEPSLHPTSINPDITLLLDKPSLPVRVGGKALFWLPIAQAGSWFGHLTSWPGHHTDRKAANNTAEMGILAS
jgi:hypothetical protein